MNKLTSSLPLFLVLFILSALFLISLFLPSSFISPSKPTTYHPPLPTPSPTPLPWQTYQNRKYHYSFSYPPNWRLSEWDLQKAANLKNPPNGSILAQTIVEGEKGRLEVLVWLNQTKLPLRRFLATFRHEDLNLQKIPRKENAVFAAQPALRFLQNQTARHKPLEYIFFQKENLIYEILMEQSYLNLQNPLYDQVLFSFHF